MAYCVEPPGGVVAWWSANGHALDVMGGNHGQTPFGMVYRTNYVGNYDTNYVGGYGIISAAFEFDGISQRRVSIPDRPAFALSSFSIEATVEFRGSEGFIFFRGDNRAGYDAYTLTMTGPRTVQFSVGGADGNYASVQAFAPSNVSFYPRTQIAATFDSTNGEMRLYFDGSLAARTNTAIRPLLALDPTQEPAIGIGNHGGTFHHFPFNGIIDDVVLYNRALSEAEVYTWRYPTRCMRTLPPVFTLQPSDTTVYVGSDLTLAVAFENDTVLNRVQWRLDGRPLAGQTNRTLRIQNPRNELSGGVYSVFATNDFGWAVSSNALITVVATNHCAPVAEDVAAWWNFNSITSVVGGVQLIPQGPPYFTEGKVGGGIDFPSPTNIYYLRALPGQVNLESEEGLTIETWIKPATLARQQAIVEWNNGAEGIGVNMFISIEALGGPGSIFANLKDTSGVDHYLASSPNVLRTGVWQHVAVTYDKRSGDAVLYVDGLVVGEAKFPSFTPRTSYAMNVGRRISGPGMGSQFEGRMDELTVYRKALSAMDVVAIYLMDTHGKCLPGIAPTIQQHPSSLTVTQGANVTLKTVATGTEPLSYQWRRSGTNVPGATMASLIITNAQPVHSGPYSARVWNAFGEVVSQTGVLTVLPSTPVTHCAPLASGAAAWWSFDPGLTDGVAGIILSNTGGFGGEKAMVGNGYSFFNTNGVQYLSAPAGVVNPGTGEGMTIEMWIKPWTLGVQQAVVEWNGGNGKVGANFFITIPLLGGVGSIFMNYMDTNGVDHYLASNPNVLKTNEWQHIATTYDKASGIARIYLDGTIVATKNLGNFTPQTTYAFNLGRRTSGPGMGSQFRGVMDEVTLYRRALGESEIRAVYNAKGAGKCGQAVAPIITRQPVSQQLSPGQTLRLEAEVGGTLPIQFQWYRNHEKLLGATMPVLTISNVTSAIQGTYYLGATNLYGWVVSTNVQVTVTAGSAPTIVRQPISQTAGTGQTAFFSLEATGTAPLRYAWRKDGIYLLNATNSSLVISNVNYSDAGLYSARVTNLYGTVFSGSAYLTVTQSTFGCVQAPSGLVTWWRGELNAADQLGYLPSYSNTTKFALGKVGYAFNFDGAKDTVTNHMPRLTNVLDNYTYEFWAKPTAGRAVTPEMLEGLAGISGQRYAVFPFNGLQGAVGSGVSVGTNGVSVFEHGDTYLSSLLVYNATNWDWVHVAVVYSNRQPSLYLNGTPVRTGLRSTRSSSPSTFLGMNNAMPTDYGHYAGLLDEVSIYSRRLSSQEIHAIYTAGAAGKCVNVGGAPVLTQHPNSQQLLAGQTLFLSVAATGAQPLHYTWFRNDQAIQGGIDWPTLVISNVTVAHQGVYHVRVTNLFGSAISSNVVVTVSTSSGPVIVRQPISQWVGQGDLAYFDVEATGTPPLRYQWYKGYASLIPYATNRWFAITNVTAADVDVYWVAVMNAQGYASSMTAQLTLTNSGACVPLPTNAAAWWRAETNYVDQVGMLNGLPQNMDFIPGKVGHAFGFNGIGTVTNAGPSLTNILDSYTMEFWAKPTALRTSTVESNQGTSGLSGQRYAIFPAKGPYGFSGSGVSVGINGVSVFEHGDTNLSSPLVHAYAIQDWTHIAVVYSNRQPRLFINGELVRTGLRSTRPSFPSTFLGGDRGMTNINSYYMGGLDEVTIYSRALGSQEIRAIYAASSAGKCPAILGTKPSITQQPISQVVTQGQTATFTVGAAGTAPLYYQWTRNQSPVPGGTNAVLVLANAQPSQEGSYQVRVTNLYGLIWSTGVQLRVLPAPTPQLRIASMTNVVIGSAFYLPIEFTGRGVENAMSFSIAYPANRMRFDGLLSGDAASNATILTNTNMLSAGLLGIALAMPADTTFGSGVAVWARFIASSNQLPGTANISFTSTPILMDMVDGAGNRVFPSYFGGTVTFSSGIEGDVAPLGNTDNQVRLQDWVLIGRMAAGKQTASPGLEFMKADCSPRTTLGDGRLTVSDWVQAGRYVAGLDPSTPAGGPATNLPFVASARKSSAFPSSTIRATSTGLRPGTEGAVVTEVLARGGENALGFSLGFDPAALEYRSVAMAPVAAGATLEVNAAQAAAGRLGIILALPTGRSFDPGSQQVLRFTFHAKAPQGTKTGITFADEPVARELADVLAQPMDAVFVPGIVTVDPRPALTLEIRNDRVVLQWPAWASDCALEVTEDASLEHWGAAPTNATVNQDACTLELPLSGKSQFFRLRQN